MRECDCPAWVIACFHDGAAGIRVVIGDASYPLACDYHPRLNGYTVAVLEGPPVLSPICGACLAWADPHILNMPSQLFSTSEARAEFAVRCEELRRA